MKLLSWFFEDVLKYTRMETPPPQINVLVWKPTRWGVVTDPEWQKSPPFVALQRSVEFKTTNNQEFRVIYSGSGITVVGAWRNAR